MVPHVDLALVCSLVSRFSRPVLTRFVPAAFATAALVLTGCGGSPDRVRTISVVSVSGGAGFEPAAITVDKDDNVKLIVRNTATSQHGFSIEGYGIQETVDGGQTLEHKFKSTKPGTFRIYCQLHETHRVATLVVR